MGCVARLVLNVVWRVVFARIVDVVGLRRWFCRVFRREDFVFVMERRETVAFLWWWWKGLFVLWTGLSLMSFVQK